MAWDGSTNEALQCFIEQMCASNKPIAAVDHGVCALVTACISRADDPNKGQCILYDKKVRVNIKPCKSLICSRTEGEVAAAPG